MNANKPTQPTYRLEDFPPAVQTQLRFADAAGLTDEYLYHLSMFLEPLPFGVWRRKYNRLIAIQARADYRSGAPCPYENEANQLCIQLGY